MHDNREVEFILFKRELEECYAEGALQLDYQSCEMMAESLINYIEEYVTFLSNYISYFKYLWFK